MDNKLEVTIHMPVANRPYSIPEEVVIKSLDKFKDLPITMDENVVGLCRGAHISAAGDVIEVDAVIWGKVCGVNFLAENNAPISISITR